MVVALNLDGVWWARVLAVQPDFWQSLLDA